MMVNPVVHWEIGGQDGAALQKYYADLFDWNVNVVEEMGNYGLVEATEGEPGIGGGIMQAPEGFPSFLTIYVQVEDLDASLARAERLGGSKVMDPMPIPGVGTVSMITDPEGNQVGLIQPE